MKHRGEIAVAVVFVLASCSLLASCNAVLRALPGPVTDTPRVSPELDERVRNLEAPVGKSIVYVYQLGNRNLPNTSDVIFSENDLGRIWPGTYLYAVIEPGAFAVKSTVQIRYSDRRQSHPIAYHNAWGTLNVEPGRRYFIQLVNRLDDSHSADQYSDEITDYYELKFVSVDSEPLEFGQVELSFFHNFNTDARVFDKPKVDLCPFGSDVADFNDRILGPIPCSFEKSF